MKKQKFVVLVMVALALVMGLSVVYAAPVVIDTFDDDPQTATAVTNGVPVCDTVDGSAMVGGERDISVVRTNGGDSVAATVDTTNPNRYAFSVGAGTSGEASIQWDGNDNSCAINPIGLAGVNLDPNDGLSFFVVQVDLGAQVRMRVYTDATHFSEYNVTVANAVTPPGYEIFFPFSLFATGSGAVGPANFANVGAIELYISGPESVDLVLDFVSSDVTRDFGDLPAAYANTLAANDGARHIVGSHYFGTSVDTEANGQESTNATGDNLARSNDELGIVPVVGSNWGDGGGQLQINVTKPTATTACVLGWIDWDQDNVFELTSSIGGKSEFVMNRARGNAAVSPFIQNIVTPTQGEYGGAYPATLNARFRIFNAYDPLFPIDALDDGGSGCPTLDQGAAMALVLGQAVNGEVEDYQWSFTPTAVSLQSFSAGNSSNPVVFGVVGFVALIMVGFVALVLRREQKKA